MRKTSVMVSASLVIGALGWVSPAVAQMRADGGDDATIQIDSVAWSSPGTLTVSGSYYCPVARDSIGSVEVRGWQPPGSVRTVFAVADVDENRDCDGKARTFSAVLTPATGKPLFEAGVKTAVDAGFSTRDQEDGATAYLEVVPGIGKSVLQIDGATWTSPGKTVTVKGTFTCPAAAGKVTETRVKISQYDARTRAWTTASAQVKTDATCDGKAHAFKLAASPRKGTLKLKTKVKLEGAYLTSKGETVTTEREATMTK
jgi:hypothetical protein